MFRFVTELKGLIIDIDSFEKNYQEWEPLFERYHCCCLTEDKLLSTELKRQLGVNKVLYIEKWEKFLAPNKKTHNEALQLMELLTTEVAYVSKDLNILKNALGFMSGTILIEEVPTKYKYAGICPDLVVNSVEMLAKRLEQNRIGFCGENCISPENTSLSGMMLPMLSNQDDEIVKIFSLGRYFGYDHYMSQLHPYSSAIYLNKQEGRTYYGVFDAQFSDLYFRAALKIKERLDVDCICNVPVRPGKTDRFRQIVSELSIRTELEDISEKFICTKDYTSQKRFNSQERVENVKGVFLYTGQLCGKRVLLIDDIISTGATVLECVRTLKVAGASEVVVLTLAVNQLGLTYWSSSQPIVECPYCGEKMRLLVNGTTGSFFYKCNGCPKTINYMVGKKQLIEKVNAEFVGKLEDEDMEFLS